jgi:hypothetical protein
MVRAPLRRSILKTHTASTPQRRESECSSSRSSGGHRRFSFGHRVKYPSQSELSELSHGELSELSELSEVPSSVNSVKYPSQ